MGSFREPSQASGSPTQSQYEELLRQLTVLSGQLNFGDAPPETTKTFASLAQYVLGQLVDAEKIAHVTPDKQVQAKLLAEFAELKGEFVETAGGTVEPAQLQKMLAGWALELVNSLGTQMSKLSLEA